MHTLGITAFGIRCPHWFFPRITAEERGDGERLHFDVRAVLINGAGLVRYTGYLDLPATEAESTQ